MAMNKLVLVKFGGSILTDKEQPCFIRQNLMNQLAQCLSKFSGKVLLGNGGGSFGHYFASKYNLVNGISNKESVMGMCQGKQGNAYLNNKLVQSLIKCNIAACSCYIGASFSKKSDDLELWNQVVNYLNCGILPVVYGDIIFDINKGCRIISTEDIFLSFVQMINKYPIYGYQVDKIIFCTDRDGVEDENGKIISTICRSDFNKWEIFKENMKGYNVTGGMFGKVKMAFELQCPTQIINGNNPENLMEALTGNHNIGTFIIE